MVYMVYIWYVWYIYMVYMVYMVYIYGIYGIYMWYIWYIWYIYIWYIWYIYIWYIWYINIWYIWYIYGIYGIYIYITNQYSSVIITPMGGSPKTSAASQSRLRSWSQASKASSQTFRSVRRLSFLWLTTHLLMLIYLILYVICGNYVK